MHRRGEGEEGKKWPNYITISKTKKKNDKKSLLGEGRFQWRPQDGLQSLSICPMLPYSLTSLIVIPNFYFPRTFLSV